MIQDRINKMSSKLRLAIIVTLLQKDILENNASRSTPSEEEMMWRAKEIYQLKCCTRMLPSLFNDVRAMREEKGQFAGPVSVGDLKWCLENRFIGYQCNQRVPYHWLPYRSDTDLRALPEFKAINEEYKKLVSMGLPILPPKFKKENNDNNMITMSLDITNRIGGER